jgi:hypothetical protein
MCRPMRCRGKASLRSSRAAILVRKAESSRGSILPGDAAGKGGAADPAQGVGERLEEGPPVQRIRHSVPLPSSLSQRFPSLSSVKPTGRPQT